MLDTYQSVDASPKYGCVGIDSARLRVRNTFIELLLPTPVGTPREGAPLTTPACFAPLVINCVPTSSPKVSPSPQFRKCKPDPLKFSSHSSMMSIPESPSEDEFSGENTPSRCTPPPIYQSLQTSFIPAPTRDPTTAPAPTPAREFLAKRVSIKLTDFIKTPTDMTIPAFSNNYSHFDGNATSYNAYQRQHAQSNVRQHPHNDYSHGPQQPDRLQYSYSAPEKQYYEQQQPQHAYGAAKWNYSARKHYGMENSQYDYDDTTSEAYHADTDEQPQPQYDLTPVKVLPCVPPPTMPAPCLSPQCGPCAPPLVSPVVVPTARSFPSPPVAEATPIIGLAAPLPHPEACPPPADVVCSPSSAGREDIPAPPPAAAPCAPPPAAGPCVPPPAGALPPPPTGPIAPPPAGAPVSDEAVLPASPPNEPKEEAVTEAKNDTKALLHAALKSKNPRAIKAVLTLAQNAGFTSSEFRHLVKQTSDFCQKQAALQQARANSTASPPGNSANPAKDEEQSSDKTEERDIDVEPLSSEVSSDAVSPCIPENIPATHVQQTTTTRVPEDIPVKHADTEAQQTTSGAPDKILVAHADAVLKTTTGRHGRSGRRNNNKYSGSTADKGDEDGSTAGKYSDSAAGNWHGRSWDVSKGVHCAQEWYAGPRVWRKTGGHGKGVAIAEHTTTEQSRPKTWAERLKNSAK